VDQAEILLLFDEQMRRAKVGPDGLLAEDGWAAVLWPPADGDVEPLVGRLRSLSGHVEWKYFSHDGPALRERLLAAGLVPQAEETVVVAEAASLAPPPADADLREEPEAFSELAARVFGRPSALPADAVAVVAFLEGRPVSGGRVDLEPGVEFAGLFGGVTLPEHRGRGLYRATVARRAELARAAGYRWLYAEALPTSRPILERLGFAAITSTTPYVFAPA
jgi:GNAT superfamily N-acetyltransferase